MAIDKAAQILFDSRQLRRFDLVVKFEGRNRSDVIRELVDLYIIESCANEPELRALIDKER